MWPRKGAGERDGATGAPGGIAAGAAGGSAGAGRTLAGRGSLAGSSPRGGGTALAGAPPSSSRGGGPAGGPAGGGGGAAPPWPSPAPSVLLVESDEPGSEFVLRLRSYFAAGSAVVLATDFMVGDLGEIIRNWESPLTLAQSKSYALQLMRGLAFIHSQQIIHRDLKPSNLLISPSRRLKIADFGLARLKSDRPMSHQVGTRWYRAPELLYSAKTYDYGVDLWSAGTIIGELYNFSPLFPGHSGSISKKSHN